MIPLPSNSPETFDLCEVVADLATNLTVSPHLPEDSREFTRLCIEWAEIFHVRHANREWNGEYMEEVDKFFAEQYEAWLASGEATRPNHFIHHRNDK